MNTVVDAVPRRTWSEFFKGTTRADQLLADLQKAGIRGAWMENLQTFLGRKNDEKSVAGLSMCSVMYGDGLCGCVSGVTYIFANKRGFFGWRCIN